MIAKVVHGVVDALKSNPTCLAAIVVVGLFTALTYVREDRLATTEEIRLKELLNLLESCIGGKS